MSPAAQPPSLAPEPPSSAPADPRVPEPAGAALHDPARRAFFFQFGKQAVSAVGQVVGVADLVGRTSSGMASELLGLGQPAAGAERPTFARSERGQRAVVSTAAPAAEHAFRSAYRVADDELVMLDQRGIPETLDEVAAKRGSDVAYYLRLGVTRGGPVMAQVAAYGLALTAKERAGQPAAQRDVELLRTEQALTEARPSARLIAWSMDRLRAAHANAHESLSGEGLAERLRAEADAIATDIGVWQAAITGSLVELLRTPDDRPLTVLVHGGLGTLNGGMVGTGLGALRQLHDMDRELRIFVAEGRPFMDGARLTSWELRQAGLAHHIVPDAAVAWLLAREPIDAVLMSAEWVAANGDVGALVGSQAIAQLAASPGSGQSGPGPRVIVCAPSAAFDANTPDGWAIPVELRPAREFAAYLADVPIRASDALVPATDVIPAACITTMVSELGAIAAGADR